MTVTGIEIEKIPVGGDFRIARTYTGLPSGVTISKAWLTVKLKEADADVAALIQLTITVSLTASGQITDASTPDITLFFDVSRTLTGNAKPMVYYFDIQVQNSAGAIHTLEKGSIRFIRRITQAQV